MPDQYQSLSHSKWDCKYHVVFIPKYRRHALYAHIRRALGPIFHELARQKECHIVEGHVMSDHVQYVHCYSAEARGGISDWIPERQKCDCHCQTVSRTATQL